MSPMDPRDFAALTGFCGDCGRHDHVDGCPATRPVGPDFAAYRDGWRAAYTVALHDVQALTDHNTELRARLSMAQAAVGLFRTELARDTHLPASAIGLHTSRIADALNTPLSEVENANA